MIEGVKLLRGTGYAGHAPDPGLPWRLELNLSPPELMRVTFVMLYGGSEEFVFMVGSRERVDELIEVLRPDFGCNPRLRWVAVTDPSGAVERREGFPPRKETT